MFIYSVTFSKCGEQCFTSFVQATKLRYYPCPKITILPLFKFTSLRSPPEVVVVPPWYQLLPP
ncbi:hypothetical protein HanRHA438_Chr09g0382671 [Helianthus annuus]|nr:hypothetical protein HanRHA438_Chr09g0382671 [Helianthus annuus]